jgi:UDP-glucose 4-epimerase
MKNNIILVTGGAGFLGGHLVDKLIYLGYQVKVIDDFSSGTYQNPLTEYFPFDISKLSQMDLCNILKDVKCVIHLAAKARVQPSYDDVLKYNEVNVTGTLNLLEACRTVGIKDFIFASSSSVYGDKWSNTPSHELEPLNPLSPYALQKVIGEDYCNLYQTFGIDCRILRFFNVYGERMIDGGQYQQAIKIFLNNYKQGEPFKIFGDGDQRRDFTYVGDIVDGIVLSMEKNVRGTFNLGSGQNHSINELCDMIDVRHPRFWGVAKKEPLITLANNELAKKVLGWEPKMKLKDWIKSQINE